MKTSEKVFIIISLALLLFVGVNVRGSAEGFLFDDFILGKIHSLLNPRLGSLGYYIMKFFSFLGSKYFMILALFGLVAYYIYKGERRSSRLVFTSIVGSYGLNAILKLIFIRVRPIDYMIVEKSGYSFPSGHSMVSMSFYCMMSYILITKMKKNGKKNLIKAISLVIVFLIGFSRLYLGVHWPTDVIVGFLMGYSIYLFGREKIRD